MNENSHSMVTLGSSETIPVAAGILAGVALIVLFALNTGPTSPILRPTMSTSEPAEVILVVTDYNTGENQNYQGLRGSYCWNICADTFIRVPSEKINITSGSTLSFEFIDKYHGNRQPDDLAILAYNMKDLDIRILPNNEQVATPTSGGSESSHYLTDAGNHVFNLDLADGEYLLSAFSAWRQMNSVYGDGDVVYYYHVLVKGEQ